MQLVLAHLPHIVPAVTGIWFLVRFAVTARRLPPAGLTDGQLAAWHQSRRHGGRRRRDELASE
jgi:hypothetical protein